MNLNKFFLSFFLLPTIFLICCSKNKEESSSQIQEEVISESFVSGRVLSKKAGLCLLGRDSKMHSLIRLSAGDEISVLELKGIIDTKFIPDSQDEKSNEAGAKNGESPASAESQESISGKEYVHVVYDNMDFWLEKSLIALNCESAVVIEKTYLYSDAALSERLDNGVNPLRFATLIAIEKNTEMNENPQSVKVFYFDSGLNSVQEAYLSADSISSREDDIVVSQIAEELKVTKRAHPRNELFARAAKYKPCAKVLAALNSQKEEKRTYSYKEAVRNMQKMSFGVNVDELLTVDQSKDPFK